MKNLMMFAALVAAGCGATVEDELAAGAKDDTTDGGVEAEPEPGEPCEANAFLGCSGNVAKRCAADGVTVTQETCDSGCNAGAERCNECDPDAVTCSGSALQTCGADGLVASTESCTLGCSATEARCEHIVPAYLPNVCDAPATTPLTVTQTTIFNTDAEASCTGGVIAQANGPAICVVHHSTISLNAKITVRGSRAIAFVADQDLVAAHDIDVAAQGRISGPGGGFKVSGEKANSVGGGGAGGNVTGGRGGSGGLFNQPGSAGGAAFDPFFTNTFVGGDKAATVPGATVGNPAPTGGGGGGALMLVACRGVLQFDGEIVASGGGGTGGSDVNTTSTVTLVGGAGGGAGGYVVLQGAEVTVNGRVFANGGGGGGGCIVDGCRGRAGDDGLSPTSSGNGGAATGSAGAGGNGASGSSGPGLTPSNTSLPGGGGGSTGWVQIFTAAGVSPVVSPLATLSPPLEPNRTVSTR